MAVIVFKDKCPQNHPCPAIRVCPANALQQHGVEAPTVDETKCTDCGECTRNCAMGALVLIKKDRKK